MNHQITEIQITPIKPQNGIVAFASLLLDGCLYLGSIAVMTRPQGGYRLVFPTKKLGTRDINLFHPIEKNFAQSIEKAVIDELEKVMNRNDRHDCFNTQPYRISDFRS
ncbi:MAG: SpoVG family protein [Candidatus Omnitrophica bacterium]|nr:SpoVG family protein [Candidatus Omnitrophota bacterium]